MEDILKEHLTPSKYGYFATQEGYRHLIDQMTEFLMTSRSIKSKGDHILSGSRKEKPKPIENFPSPPSSTRQY